MLRFLLTLTLTAVLLVPQGAQAQECSATRPCDPPFELMGKAFAMLSCLGGVPDSEYLSYNLDRYPEVSVLIGSPVGPFRLIGWQSAIDHPQGIDLVLPSPDRPQRVPTVALRPNEADAQAIVHCYYGGLHGLAR